MTLQWQGRDKKRNIRFILMWRCLLKIYLPVLLIAAFQASAIERINLHIDEIKAQNWLIKQAELRLDTIGGDKPSLQIHAGILKLPVPLRTCSKSLRAADSCVRTERRNRSLHRVNEDFEHCPNANGNGVVDFEQVLRNFQQFSIHCSDFVMQSGKMACRQGRGRLHWPALGSPTFDFRLDVTEQGGLLEITKLKIFAGSINITLTEHQWQWRANVQATHLDLAKIQRFLKISEIEKISGKLSFKAQLRGGEKGFQRGEISSQIYALKLKAFKESLLTEKNHVSVQLNLSRKPAQWYWKTRLTLDEGAVFYDPVFVTFSKQQPLTLAASGTLRATNKALWLRKLLLTQGDNVQITGSANFKQSFDADLQIIVNNLNEAGKIFLSPFLETGPLADLVLFGQMHADVLIKQNKLDSVNTKLSAVDIQQPGNYIDIKQLDGQLAWRQQEHDQPSFLQWKKMIIKKIPIEAGRLDFKLFDKQMALLKPTRLSMLDGVFSIRAFRFQAIKNDDAKVFFEGGVKNLSLEKLTQALDWTPLSGTISGYIPAVHYQDKTLRLDGQLAIQVFGGEIIIKELSSSGLFGFSPRLHTDIEFNNLDLKQITQKFKIGRIEGRLSGFAHNVYLENWKPVTFYAWLGTPDDDDSRHVISQNAVENIASIGGGGAADVISRGFLRFFDTYGYDKLGFGCYLHNGVCQMMGVEAASNGYYLIKGGGLPRIDVIGYNPRLDWDVLIQRLKRIGATDEVIVQ